jgi:hypothetical protein
MFYIPATLIALSIKGAVDSHILLTPALWLDD